MYHITVVMHDGAVIEGERSTREGAALFAQSCRRWGIQYLGQLCRPNKIKEILIVKREDDAGSSSNGKPRVKRGPRKTAGSRGRTKD